MRAGNQLRHRERSLEDGRPPACQIQRKNKAYSKDSAGSGHRVDSKSSSLSSFKSISSVQSSSSVESSSSTKARDISSQEAYSRFVHIPMRKGCRQQTLKDLTGGTRVPRSWVAKCIQSTINWYMTKHKETCGPVQPRVAPNAYPSSCQTIAS